MANFWGTLPPQIFFSSGGNVWYLVAICGSVTGGGGNRWSSLYLQGVQSFLQIKNFHWQNAETTEGVTFGHFGTLTC